MIDLPTPRLVLDHVPAEARQWVERALVAPLNRFLQPVADSLKRIMLAQVNVQVLEHKGLPPSTSSPVDFPSTLTGSCVGLWPIYCRELLANGGLGAQVEALVSPLWYEVVKSGQSGATIRVTSQQPLSAAVRYVTRWLAIGG